MTSLARSTAVHPPPARRGVICRASSANGTASTRASGAGHRKVSGSGFSRPCRTIPTSNTSSSTQPTSGSISMAPAKRGNQNQAIGKSRGRPHGEGGQWIQFASRRWTALSETVNTGFILHMQRKLYRWSAADPEKRFADLFNIVCDRRMLLHAWQRLARNRGSNTPGTDHVTRRAPNASSSRSECKRRATAAPALSSRIAPRGTSGRMASSSSAITV